MKLLAVYGTLKLGGSNHTTFLDNAKFIGNGETTQNFNMKKMGGYPGGYRTTIRPEKIAVEVFEVDTFTHLDYLEGHPSFFIREIEEITLDNGDVVHAWMYRLAQPEEYNHKENYTHTNSNGAIDWSYKNV